MQDAPGSHPMTASIDLPVIDSPSDLELVAAIRSGDDFAFSRLWHRHEAAATTAAAATPGHAGVEQVVAAAAALVAHAIRHGGGPTGAARPYMLAAVREAASAADGRAAGVADGDPPLLSPADWHSGTLPEGMRDGEAVVRAYGALPVMAQEALWLAEVDGRSTADIAAELGVTVARAEGLVVESVTALDAAWADTVTASAPADSDCARVLARRSLGDRVTERLRPKVRAHLDACATCRAAGGEPGALAERLMTSLPILVLGGAAGVAFLEATRPGSSATALEPVPPIDERGAVATLIAATGAGIAGITRAPEPVVALPAAPTAAVGAPSGAPFPVAARAAIRRIPARGRLAIAGAVGTAAAAAVVLAVSLTGPISTDLGASFEASGGTDVAEPAPGMMPPVVVATEVPADDEAPGAGTDPAPPAGPDAGAPAPAPAPSPEAGREPPQESGEPGGSGAADPGPAPTETPGETPTPRPTTPPTDEDGSSALQPGRPGAPTIRDPQSEPAPPSTPIRFEYSRPGANGWRTLTLTGIPGASYVVTNHGDVLYTGVLGPDGTTELAVRGSVANLDVQYDQSKLAAVTEPLTGE